MIAKKISKVLSQNTTRVKSVDFHPVKPIFIIGLHDGRIQAWDYNSNACIYEFKDPNCLEMGSIRSLRFHPHGDFFVTCGDDKIIRMWDYTKRKLIKSFKGHFDFIRSVDFHPTKTWIISASDDQTICVWNFMTGKCMATATGHSHYVMSAKFLDETTIISGSLDNTIRIWDCKNLLEKTNKFVPNIVVKQIIQGHDRGINFIEICVENEEIVILSGGDDREVKVWEYRNELVERESFMVHQGCVTSARKYQNYIVSVGEDGIFCVYDLKTRKYDKYVIDGRFWNLSGRNGFFVCGHDNGFEILEYSEPKLMAISDKGCFYLKKTHFYYSDLITERKICKAEGDVVSIHSIRNYLLIQYRTKFEVYDQNKKIYKDDNNGVLMYDNELLIVIKKYNTVTIKNLDKKVNSFEVVDGQILFGNEKSFFISKNFGIIRYSKDGLVDTLSLGFNCEKVYCSKTNEFAFVSKNKLSIFDINFNLVNYENEICNIRSGFFHDEIFIYSTNKHLKYIFAEQGVIISVDNLIYPFYYSDNLIYYLSDEGIESMEIDMTEVIFKKLVISDTSELTDITNIIESGSLPGLSPLSFLIKKHKGNIALPYIKNPKQRFELCLSTGKLEECLRYCEEHDDHQMYKKLSLIALENTNFEIAEKCLLYLHEYYDLFLLYICSDKIDRLEKLVEICDNQTEKIVRLYLEDTKYFYKNNTENINTKNINTENIKKNNIKKNNIKENNSTVNINTKNINTNNNSTENIKKNNSTKNIEKNNSTNNNSTENIEMNIADINISTENNTNVIDTDNKEAFINKTLLQELEFEDVEFDSSYQEALTCVTKGNFLVALEIFKNVLYTIAKNVDKDPRNDVRKSLGSYISGLNTQLLRKKEEDGRKQIILAKYFASLDLKDEHKKLAKLELISVCLKNGNYLQAKELAIGFNEEEKPKIVKKALKIEDAENAFEIPVGTFCYDVKDYTSEYKKCMYCYVDSQNGEICTLCEIGYLSK